MATSSNSGKRVTRRAFVIGGAGPGAACPRLSSSRTAWAMLRPKRGLSRLHRGQCLGRGQARRHLGHSNRASEMGEGTITGLAQLVAEEPECDWKKVRYEYPTPGQSHARKRVWGEMSTGGSRGIRMSHDYVRRGGAAARLMLLEAAAQQWKVRAGESDRRQRHRQPMPHRSARSAMASWRPLRRRLPHRREGDHAQGPEEMVDRRQTAEAARYGNEAQRRQTVRHRRQIAGHAQRRDQGGPGTRQ